MILIFGRFELLYIHCIQFFEIPTPPIQSSYRAVHFFVWCNEAIVKRLSSSTELSEGNALVWVNEQDLHITDESK